MKHKTSAKKVKPKTQEPLALEIDLRVLEDTPPWDWPKDVGKRLHAVMTNSNAPLADRVLAAELAGDYVAINDELAEALMGLLGNSNEPEELRARAAISFGPALDAGDTNDFDDPYTTVPISQSTFEKIKRLLHLLFHEESVPKLVRRRILEASVRAQEAWHADAMKRAYYSQDPDWVLTAVFCMRYVQGFETEIVEALHHKDLHVRVAAVHAAGNQEVDAAWDQVYALLENETRTPKPLLLAAIGCIGCLRQDTPSLEILNHLVDSNDLQVSEAADEALLEAGAYTPFDEDDFDGEDDMVGDASGWIN